jgi:hypothetical protein
MSLLAEAQAEAALILDEEALAAEELQEQEALLNTQRHRRLQARLGDLPVRTEVISGTRYLLVEDLVFVERAERRGPRNRNGEPTLTVWTLEVLGVNPNSYSELADWEQELLGDDREAPPVLAQMPLRRRADLANIVADNPNIIFNMEAVLGFLANRDTRAF